VLCNRSRNGIHLLKSLMVLRSNQVLNLELSNVGIVLTGRKGKVPIKIRIFMASFALDCTNRSGCPLFRRHAIRPAQVGTGFAGCIVGCYCVSDIRIPASTISSPSSSNAKFSSNTR
jgi:hypothetical protein